MAEEAQVMAADMGSRKRKLGHKKGKGAKSKKKPKVFHGPGDKKMKKKPKIDKKMQKLYRKRAREYNSDTDDENNNNNNKHEEEDKEEEVEEKTKDYSEDEEEEEESQETQSGIMKFVEGCRAFRKAFMKIMKKTTLVPDDSLGPVLSAQKKLVAKKLAQEEAERKVKGDANKHKHLVGEKGHVKPANFLDSHEKFLVGVATKGVVKLFNAVNKAQHAQKGLNPSRSKDAKVLRKQRKEAFFSELGKTSRPSEDTSAKAHSSMGPSDEGAPAWAPLRDGYMLTNSKLKDWDKMPDSTIADDTGRMPLDSSSDDD